MPTEEKEKLDLFDLENSSDSDHEEEDTEEVDSRFSKSRLRSLLPSNADENEEDDDDSDVSDQDDDMQDTILGEGSDSEAEAELDTESHADDGNDPLLPEGEEEEPRRIRKKKAQALTPEELEKYEKEKRRTGVCYLSHIPPFMTPRAIRSALSRHAELGRVYLAAEDPKITARRKKYKKDRRVNYTEGWVEFKDKKVARVLAQRLNLQQMGGKRKSRYYHDLWNIKYLPKFKWSHLTEQMAYENQARQQRLRNEIAQSSRENKAYIQNVERAKMHNYITERKRERGEENEVANKVRRTFEQRSMVDREVSAEALKKKQKATLDSMDPSLKNVLSKVF